MNKYTPAYPYLPPGFPTLGSSIIPVTPPQTPAKREPAISFEKLTSDYFQRQIERVKCNLEKIVDRGTHVSGSRVLPDDESLAIGEGRRLAMAVLFLDICSFSDRPAATEQEQEVLLRVVNLLFSEMIRIAEDYGGTVEKNTGDGLMAYFEDSSSHAEKNGCKRAVAAALTMFYINAKALNRILVTSGIAAITFRIGIDHHYCPGISS